MFFSNSLQKGTSKILALIFLIIGIVMILVSVYFGFLKPDKYGKTTAVITRIEPSADASGSSSDTGEMIVTVSYTIDGVEYSGVLDEWEDSYQQGKEVRIEYDLSEPSKIRTASVNIAVYPLGIGVILVVMEILTLLQIRRRQHNGKGKPSGQEEDTALGMLKELAEQEDETE